MTLKRKTDADYSQIRGMKEQSMRLLFSFLTKEILIVLMAFGKLSQY